MMQGGAQHRSSDSDTSDEQGLCYIRLHQLCSRQNRSYRSFIVAIYTMNKAQKSTNIFSVATVEQAVSHHYLASICSLFSSS